MTFKNGGDPPLDIAIITGELRPVTLARNLVENGIHLASPTLYAPTKIPHRVEADHLAVTFGLTESPSRHWDPYQLFAQTGLSLTEGMDLARSNLRKNAQPFKKTDGVYSISSSSPYNASHILLPDLIRNLSVVGEPIATVPDLQTLHVCGSEDAKSLAAMARLTGNNLRHAETISGMAFRWVGDKLEPWLPPEDHPTYDAFKALDFWTLARAYGDQKVLLDRRNVRSEPPFVESFSKIGNEEVGEVTSYTCWTEGVPTLLPQSDLVVFCRWKAKQVEIVAAADWKTVISRVGHLMALQDTYPTRFLVQEFPGSAFFKQLRDSGDQVDILEP